MGFWDSFLKVFAEKYIKYIFHLKWRMNWVWDSNNYMWLCSNLNISEAHLQTKQMHIHRKNEQYFYFSLTLKDTEIFS